jgi:hypothetical protein
MILATMILSILCILCIFKAASSFDLLFTFPGKAPVQNYGISGVAQMRM